MPNEMWDALYRQVAAVVARLPGALILLVGLWLTGKALGQVVEQLAKLRRMEDGLAGFLGQSIRVIMLVLGIVTALGTLGIDVTALVAGLGLTGFALSLAMKDILSNAMSGIMLLASHPFRAGDTISVQGFEGRVLEVNLRYTVLDREGQTIFVPNATLVANVVVVNRGGSTSTGQPLTTPTPPPAQGDPLP
jgi:small-conductance mechanosensitive channel